MTSGDAPLAIDRAGLDAVFGALERRGYTLVGPTVRDRAIVLEEIDSTAELPAGWTDVQEGGSYRLARRDDDALFGHNAGPNSWKSFLFPAELRGRPSAISRSARTTRRRRRATPSSACARARVRPARDRGAGPRVPRGRVPGPRLTAPA